MTRIGKGQILVVGISGFLAWGATAQDSKEPSRHDLYKYIWTFVVVGDGPLSQEDLKNIAAYYNFGQSEEARTKIDQLFVTSTLSNHQKHEAICRLMPAVRYGTLVTRAGETCKGVIEIVYSRDERERPKDMAALSINLTTGGKADIPLREIVEIEWGEGQRALDKYYVKLKTNRGEILAGQLIFNTFFQVVSDGRKPITIDQASTKRLVCGTLKHVQCPACFRTMEIDWKFCPYDGAKVTAELRPGKSDVH